MTLERASRMRMLEFPKSGTIVCWQDANGWRASFCSLPDHMPWPRCGVAGFATEREAYEAAVVKVKKRMPGLRGFAEWDDAWADEGVQS